jgi:hypothetical protein
VLARYHIVRGKRGPEDPLPEGVRLDVRMHTKHFLRPPREAVRAFLENPTDAAFDRFAKTYEACLEERFAQDRTPFDELATRARHEDVYIGCNCPTRKQPLVSRCHTVLGLAFMKRKYRALRVVLPAKTR